MLEIKFMKSNNKIQIHLLERKVDENVPLNVKLKKLNLEEAELNGEKI